MSNSQYNIVVQDALEIRIEEIKKTLALVTTLKKWDYKYAKNKWTIKELIQHCIDCERIFTTRALQIARNDAKTFTLFDENEYVKNLNAKILKPENLVKEWLHLMNATLLQYNGYDEEILNKSAKIGEKNITVREIGEKIAKHSIHHINIIKERYI